MESRPHAAWLRWPLTLVALALIGLLAYVFTVRSAGSAAREVGRVVGETGRRLEGIAARFRTETITEVFTAALPDIASTGHGNLELATSTVTETLRRSDERRIFWDTVSLGETVSEIRVPVTYRYHVRLDEPWKLEVSGNTCVVEAPALRPTLPPAIHTDGLERRASEGWLRFDGAQQMQELERSLTPTLEAYAADERHLNAAREQSRRTLARFVRSWLLREDHWREDRFRAIVVHFADETTTDFAVGPSLTLDE